ncbi:hypothetical protein [Spirosoma flavum]|uniref:DNA-directed RNA polymerase n=1 Tax=Spirosoma flavum TaxID=2048557 RepID=A0ABW6ARL3_9BACT
MKNEPQYVNKGIACQIPENLDLDTLLVSNPPSFRCKKDGLVYFIDLILNQNSWRKNNRQTLMNGYVPLHSQRMRDILTNYHLYINYLADSQVIEVYQSYKVGERSKGYRLASQYQTGTINAEITDPKIVKNILEQTDQSRQKVMALYPHLVKAFDGLEIDAEGAYQFIDQWYASQLSKLKRKPKPERAKKLIQTSDRFRRSVQRIQLKDYRFHVDDSGHRLHTVLTQMKKELRQYLTYKGQPLVCWDLSSAQPLLSLQLLKESFYDYIDKPCSANHEITLFDLPENIRNSIRPAIPQIRELITSEGFRGPWYERHTEGAYDGYQSLNFKLVPLSSEPIIGGDHVFSPFRMKEVVDEFNNLTVCIETDWMWYKIYIIKGRFYQYLEEEFERRNPVAGDKRNTKKIVMNVLFAKDSDMRGDFPEFRNMIRALFPTMVELFRLIKERDHSTLAILLQSMESEIFLNRIVSRINRNRPEIPLFTVHDSIATTPPYQEYVQEIMREELEKAIGYPPHLKPEQWSTRVKSLIRRD